MLREINIAFNIFLARRHVGKDRGEQIFRAHALDLRRNLFSSLEAQQGERAICIPAKTGSEDGREQRGLLQNIFHRLRRKEVEDVAQRKTVLLGQRNVEPVIGGRGL